MRKNTPKIGRGTLTLRFRDTASEKLDIILDRLKQDYFYKISRTDIIEAMIFWLAKQEFGKVTEIMAGVPKSDENIGNDTQSTCNAIASNIE